VAVIGHTNHQDENGNEHGHDDEPSLAVAHVAPGPSDSADEASETEPTAPPELAAGPGPAVPLRWLLLVTLVNLALAAALLTVRPPGRVERAAAPTALPPQVAQLGAQVQRGEHGAPYRLVLTDDELSATAGYFLARAGDVPFSQVRIAVAGGQIEANAVTTGLAVAAPVRVRGNVTARDGAPVVEVTDVGIGGLPLTAFAHEQVLREANRAVDLSRYDLPIIVDGVELRIGELELRGSVK
jgi:hypothetical protein